MDQYLALIFVGPEQLFPILVAVVLWLALAGVGSLLTASDRIVDANVLFGWAAVSTVFTLTGTWIRAPFLWLTIIFAALAVIGIALALRRRQQLFVPGAWRILIIAFPLMFIAGAMDPSQWDEFSHWLPAPKYLVAVDGFPNAEKPFHGPQMLSAYPYGWPILSYLGARVAGQFLDNLGGILNLFLLLTFASFAVRTGYRVATERELERINWGTAAAISLVATVLNPTFVQKIVLTAYSDVATSVGTGFGVLIAFHLLEGFAGRGRSGPRSAAWQFALMAALLINLRQPNVLLLGFIFVGMALIALRDHEIESRKFLAVSVLALIPAVTVYVAWRFYVGQELSALSYAEATFRPLAEWNFALIPGILSQMLVVAGKKIGFFAPMAIACYFAVRGIIRYRTGFDRLAILAAIGFLGHNSFLMLTYIGHFSPSDALRVVSFWRYNTQLGSLAIMIIVVGLLYLIHRRWPAAGYPNWLKSTAIGLAIILPLALPHKLRFDLEAPKPHYFAVARDLKAAIPVGAKIRILDPLGTGESGVISRYVLNLESVPWLAAFHDTKPLAVEKYIAGVEQNEFLLVHSTTPAVSEVLGFPVSEKESYLLRRGDTGWIVVRRWLKPPGHRG